MKNSPPHAEDSSSNATPARRSPRAVLWTCLAGMFATSFTITILGVSIKTIAQDLQSTPETIAWVLTGPMLAQALALPVLGKAGDLYGHRRVYLIGFAAATIGALLTCIAWDAATLIGFRTAAQLAGTATTPASMALLFHAYGPDARVRALGWVNLVGAGAPVLGLGIGGPLVDALGWRPIFAIQAVLSVIAFIAALRVLQETEAQRGIRIDYPGAGALAIAAFSFILALNRLPALGASHPIVLTSLTVCGAAVFVFTRIERRVRHPLIPLELFRIANFSAPISANYFLNFAYMGGFVITPLLLQSVMGLSAGVTSLIVMARPISLSLWSPVAARLAAPFGERTLGIAGAIAVTVAMLAFAAGATQQSLGWIFVGLVLAGLGLGSTGPATGALLANSVDSRSFGIASSAMSMGGSIGAVSGIGVLTAMSADANTTGPFVSGYATGAVIAALGAVALFFLKARAETKT